MNRFTAIAGVIVAAAIVVVVLALCSAVWAMLVFF